MKINKPGINEFFCLCVKLCIISVNVFWFRRKKGAVIFLTSLFKMPDKTLSKEAVNLLTSGSVSSPRLNSKHLGYVTQQAIAGVKAVYRLAIQNNVLR